MLQNQHSSRPRQEGNASCTMRTHSFCPFQNQSSFPFARNGSKRRLPADFSIARPLPFSHRTGEGIHTKNRKTNAAHPWQPTLPHPLAAYMPHPSRKKPSYVRDPQTPPRKGTEASSSKNRSRKRRRGSSVGSRRIHESESLLPPFPRKLLHLYLLLLLRRAGRGQKRLSHHHEGPEDAIERLSLRRRSPTKKATY